MWSRIMCSHSICSSVNFSPAPLWRFMIQFWKFRRTVSA